MGGEWEEAVGGEGRERGGERRKEERVRKREGESRGRGRRGEGEEEGGRERGERKGGSGRQQTNYAMQVCEMQDGECQTITGGHTHTHTHKQGTLLV